VGRAAAERETRAVGLGVAAGRAVEPRGSSMVVTILRG
jgi:hypothetical protein